MRFCKQQQRIQKVDITGEYALTEPINQYVLTGGTMKVVLAQGKYFDSGNALRLGRG